MSFPDFLALLELVERAFGGSGSLMVVSSFPCHRACLLYSGQFLGPSAWKPPVICTLCAITAAKPLAVLYVGETACCSDASFTQASKAGFLVRGAMQYISRK